MSHQISTEVDRLAGMHPFTVVFEYHGSGGFQSIVDWNQKTQLPGHWLIEIATIAGVVVWTAEVVVDMLEIVVYVCSAECGALRRTPPSTSTVAEPRPPLTWAWTSATQVTQDRRLMHPCWYSDFAGGVEISHEAVGKAEPYEA